MRIMACILIIVTLLNSGCRTLDAITQVGTSVGVATGTISSQQADSLNKSASAVGKTFDKITPEQEYYIGRAVTATILKTYKPFDNSEANRYLNIVGQALSAASDKPETFGGYHFMVMDTDEVNAFASPGGFILVSRGLLKCCKNEDAVAAVLAHEIGHVQNLHGLRAIKKSRLTSAASVVVSESAKSFAPDQIAELTTAFEGTINDISSTLVNSGYARKLESDADHAAITIMTRVGYNPNGLKDVLAETAKHSAADARGFAKTHPAPADRIRDIDPLIRKFGPVTDAGARQMRFNKALVRILHENQQ